MYVCFWCISIDWDNDELGDNDGHCNDSNKGDNDCENDSVDDKDNRDERGTMILRIKTRTMIIIATIMIKSTFGGNT